MIKINKKQKELLFYILFGLGTTVVNWLVYTPLVVWDVLNMTAANAVAWVVAVSFAFFTNKYFVFESKNFSLRQTVREAVSFFGIRLLSGVVEIFLPILLVSLGCGATLFGIEGAAAKVITNFVVIVLNYVFSKWFVFSKKRPIKKGE